jgi:hypothetical protein
MFPSSIAASLFRFAPSEYFLVDEVQVRAAPHVARQS